MNIESLFEKYNKDIYRYAYSITLNTDEAKDTVSEVFSHLITKDLSHVENPKAYLLTTARNFVYKKYAKESKLTNIDEAQEFPDIDTKSNEETAIDSYLVEVIKNQLNSLDPSTREVILLKVWDDYKFSEIADITKEKESTVKLRYYRGLEKLKENINSSTKLKSVTLPIILFGLGKLLTSFNYPKVPLVLSATKGISTLKVILGLIGIGTILVGSFFIAVNFLNNRAPSVESIVSSPVSSANEVSNKVIEYNLEIVNGTDSTRQNQTYRALIYKTETEEKEIYRWKQYSEFGTGGPNPCTEIKYNIDRSYFVVCQMSAEVLSNQQIPIVFDQYGKVVLDFSKVDSFPKDKLTSAKFGDIFFASSLLRDFSWIDRINLKLSFYNKSSGEIDDSIFNMDKYKNLVTFTHSKLPGFSMEYPSDWKIEVKEFKEKDTLSFTSFYFPSCHESCLGLRFSKNNVSIEILFDLVYDDNGYHCSDNVNIVKLSGKWYRYDSLMDYSGSIKPKYIYTESGQENAKSFMEQTGHLYKFCDSGTGGAGLIERQSIQDTYGENYDVNHPELFPSAPGIMIEKPKVYSDQSIDTEVLEEIDNMIISMKGIL